MVMVVKPLFTLKNATFWSFWLQAGLAPQPFNFWVWNICSCVLSSSKATEWPPCELILSISKFTYGIYGYTVYIRSYTAYIRYMEIPYTVWANPKYTQYDCKKIMWKNELHGDVAQHLLFSHRKAPNQGLGSQAELWPPSICAQCDLHGYKHILVQLTTSPFI